MDEVNKNDCMVVLVSLLKHMRDSNVYNHPAEVKDVFDCFSVFHMHIHFIILLCFDFFLLLLVSVYFTKVLPSH